MEQHLQKKNGLVENVFNRVFDKYDLMNDLMSLGAHRIWKKDLMMMMSPSKNKKRRINLCFKYNIRQYQPESYY